MDAVLAIVEELLKDGAIAFKGEAAGQLMSVTSALITSLPAIKKGIASEKPFIEAMIKVVSNGGKPLDPKTFDDQIAMLKAQESTVAAQIAADEAAQP